MKGRNIKIMKMKTPENITVYISILKKDGMIIAISEEMKLLKEYLDYHRQLKPNEYVIHSKYVNEIFVNFSDEYEPYILQRFYNFYITALDIEMIESEYGNLDDDLTNTINKLKYYAFLINRDKKLRPNTNALLKAIDTLSDISSSDKKINRMTKNHFLSHPIIKSNIDEYRSMQSIYLEYKANIERYRFCIDNDNM